MKLDIKRYEDDDTLPLEVRLKRLQEHHIEETTRLRKAIEMYEDSEERLVRWTIEGLLSLASRSELSMVHVTTLSWILRSGSAIRNLTEELMLSEKK